MQHFCASTHAQLPNTLIQSGGAFPQHYPPFSHPPRVPQAMILRLLDSWGVRATVLDIPFVDADGFAEEEPAVLTPLVFAFSLPLRPCIRL